MFMKTGKDGDKNLNSNLPLLKVTRNLTKSNPQYSQCALVSMHAKSATRSHLQI